MKYRVFTILFLLLVAAAGFGIYFNFTKTADIVINNTEAIQEEREVEDEIVSEIADKNKDEDENVLEPVKDKEDDKKEIPVKKENILFDVTFTSQAPFGEWSDPRQQDACEEASALMAVKWARGESFTLEEAKEEILQISKYQTDNFGEYRDTSADDTLARIIHGYFGFKNAEVQKNITKKDIIAELEKGNLVVIPTDGQLLYNPNFTPPGPERHMLVIRGYDYDKKIFITNDPGTRQGKSYKYNEDILFTAIQNYPTGYHEPIDKVEKAMITISPEFTKE